MKILLTTARFYPHRGGLESVVYNLALELQKQGHVILVVTNRYPRRLPESENIDGIPVVRLHFLRGALRFLRAGRLDLALVAWFYSFWTEYRLEKIICDFQPDMVNTHYLNEHAEIIGLCLRKHYPKIPWVVSLHGGDVDGEPLLSDTNLARFREITRQADRLTACSAFLARQAVDLEPNLAGKITPIHNGVALDVFSNACPPENQPPYIFAVGQLAWHKGFDLLIDAFAQVAPKYPDVQLWLAGDGSARHSLQSQIAALGLSGRVMMPGKLDSIGVASAMAGSLFVAMPSRREPFGIVALEGMAAGKCVLASSVGGLPEFLPCPPNQMLPLDVNTWAGMLDAWLSRAVASSMGAPGNQEIAANFSWHQVSSHYLNVFQQVLFV